MSVKSQVEVAEEALRQALINALAEGEEEYLSELFTQYQAISDLNKKVSNTIRFADNINGWQKKWGEYNFNLSSDYLDRPGGDLDAMDNINFSGDTIIGGDDVISFGDYKSRDD